jgi:DNA polymerase III epsilon subunit-like protein
MIVLDVETTGLSPERDSILSIGALDLHDPTNQFYDECRAWDGANIEDEALAVNGFTRGDAADPSRKSEAELIAAFIAWATDRPEERTLAAQNVAFDRGFVEAACRRARIECPFAHRTIDVHTLVWAHMVNRGMTPPTANHRSAVNLDAALRYCGLPEEQKPHNALTGAFSHAEVIARIVYNKKLLPDFSSYDIPWLTS